MPCVVPPEVFKAIEDTHGKFFEAISGVDRVGIVADHLDLAKSDIRAELLEKYAPFRGSKLLEIGSGVGTNLVVWIKDYGVDAYGVEPASVGFDAAFRASHILLAANGIDPARVIDAVGENLPFPDNSFDLVYSGNVLEHVQNPEKVLDEAIRVLKPGGVLHMEFPNFLSYYESHYMVFQPPMPTRALLKLWVRLRGRDPSFVDTLQLLNPVWCRRMLRTLKKRHAFQLLSLGDDVFLEKLAKPYVFRTPLSGRFLTGTVRAIQALNVGNWIGRLIVAVNGYYPIFLTIRKQA
jgi:ubiquinone/menaquinone biosynthesis C-methylase UbiE